MNAQDILRGVGAFVLGAILLGCSSAKQTTAASNTSGEQSRPGTFLAYEHKVSIRYADNVIAAREEALRKACSSDQFGQCSLLGLKQTSGNYPSGEVILRVAPDAVEPLVKIAADGGSIWMRESHAEDLAQAVADTEQSRALLTRQRQNFEHLQDRKDASVSDQLAVARELAAIEVAQDANEKAAAQQRRRIETNLLTFDLRISGEESRTSRLGSAFLNIGDSFVDGVTEALSMTGYGLPFLVLAFLAALLWRWLWRRVTGKKAVTRSA